jgi:hypothetical protein
MREKRQGSDSLKSEYSYRRSLGLTELLPAIGAGVGMGVVAFYFARLVLQRARLPALPEVSSRSGAAHPAQTREAASG